MSELNRILMIDDVELWSELLVGLFRVRKINSTRVYVEKTPDGGVKKYKDMLLHEERPDLVLLDYRFNLNTKGVNAAKEIRELDMSANIHVFTYYMTPEVIKAMKEAGIKHFISKLTKASVLTEELIRICTATKETRQSHI